MWKFKESVAMVIVNVTFQGEMPGKFKCCYVPILE